MTSSVTAQIVQVEPVAVEVEIPQPIVSTGDAAKDGLLPTEAYSEKIDLRLTVLRPSDGQYPVEIRLASDFDMDGDHSLVVGEADDIFIELLASISDLVRRRWNDSQAD